MSGLDGSHARAQGEMKDYFGDEKEVDVHINGGGEFALFFFKKILSVLNTADYRKNGKKRKVE